MMRKAKEIIFCLLMLLPLPLLAVGEGTEVTGYTREGNKVVFHAADGSALSLHVLAADMVKVWFDPTATFTRRNPSFAVVNEQPDSSLTFDLHEESNAWELFTPQLRIRMNKKPMQLQIFDKWQKLIFSDYQEQGHLADGSATSARKLLRSDEQFYGLGEKSGPLNRRGRSYTMWNSDRPCYSISEDPLYKSIPFFMSSYNYGIFLDNTYKTQFDFGEQSNDYYSFEAPDGPFIYYFIHGKDYKQILSRYIDLTGKPILPPKWAFGFAQSRGLYTKEAQALEIAAEFRRRQIPCDIIYQDIGWTQHLQDFEWREGNYSNPEQMLTTLREQGFRVILSQDPVISQNNRRQWAEADSLGFFVRDVRTGTTYDMPWPWGGNCGVVDFTLPAVADWWGAYQQKPLDAGAAGFWTDMGEPAWSNEEDLDRLHMQHHIGMHDEVHNIYGLTWDKVVKEQFEQRNPNRRVFQMTRAAYAGLQRYTFGWSGDSGNGGDVTEGWPQLRNQVAIGISAGLGGIPFWTTDISGYCGDITDHEAMAELYTRWMQFGIFNPLSRAHHEGDNAVEPWQFGERAERHSRSAIELKYRLFPYLYSYAREAHDSGLPLLRGLFMEYPHDQQALAIDDQFLFGEELLVAPVLRKGERVRRLYLPEGEWYDFHDPRQTYFGGETIAYRAPLSVIPLFVKKGSIIPMMPVMQYIHERSDYPLWVHVYPHYEEESARFELYEDEGEDLGYLENVASRTLFTCTTLPDGYRMEITPHDNGFRQSDRRNLILTFHLEEQPSRVTINGMKVKKQQETKLTERADSGNPTTGWSWNSDTGECRVTLPDDRTHATIEIR